MASPGTARISHVWQMYALAGLLILAGCADDDGATVAGAASEWQGTIETEGGVTTVLNESGSVWGGTATLVEEASIGVEAGDEPYLLGDVAGLGMADDLIFVLDAQVDQVRVYDWNGRHVRDLGRPGQGPGELRQPMDMAVGERVHVRDRGTGRITLFDTDGELIGTWPIGRLSPSLPIVATNSGELYIPSGGGMAPWGPEGQSGEVIRYPEVESPPPRLTVRVEEAIPGYSPGAMLGRVVPFWPTPVFAMSPTGAVIRGAGDAYRFTVERPDGTELRIEGRAEPVPVADAEADWHRARILEFLHQADPALEWDAPEIPAVKPAFDAFVPALSGEIWVRRPGAGYEDNACPADIPAHEPPDRCWKDTRIIDAFGADGRYLGAVDVPDELQLEPRPYLRDDAVVGVVLDEAGTIMVKRYRLVPPGDR